MLNLPSVYRDIGKESTWTPPPTFGSLQGKIIIEKTQLKDLQIFEDQKLREEQRLCGEKK